MARTDELEMTLIRRARGGDPSAFERLYRRHVGRVHALCLRLTRNTAEAEDMTQETFIRAWKKLDQFRGEALFSSWLHRMAVNMVLAHRRGALGADLASLDARPGEPEAPRKAPREQRIDLERAIALLPEGARFVFVLHEVYGHGHQEVAELLGISAGTSKAQLHRARRLLRATLEGTIRPFATGDLPAMVREATRSVMGVQTKRSLIRL